MERRERGRRARFNKGGLENRVWPYTSTGHGVVDAGRQGGERGGRVSSSTHEAGGAALVCEVDLVRQKHHTRLVIW